MKFEINKKVFDRFPELESGRLSFRHIKVKDAEALFIIRTNKEVMRFMDTEAMTSLKESEELINSIGDSFKSGNGISWGIEAKSENKLIGYFGFWRIDAKNCRGEIGYALHPDFWGKGYMMEAAETLIRFGFDKLHLHSIEANVNPLNINSIKLLERIGFKKEAYFRENFLFDNEFKDSVIYSLLKSDIDKEKNG